MGRPELIVKERCPSRSSKSSDMKMASPSNCLDSDSNLSSRASQRRKSKSTPKLRSPSVEESYVSLGVGKASNRKNSKVSKGNPSRSKGTPNVTSPTPEVSVGRESRSRTRRTSQYSTTGSPEAIKEGNKIETCRPKSKNRQTSEGSRSKSKFHSPESIDTEIHPPKKSTSIESQSRKSSNCGRRRGRSIKASGNRNVDPDQRKSNNCPTNNKISSRTRSNSTAKQKRPTQRKGSETKDPSPSPIGSRNSVVKSNLGKSASVGRKGIRKLGPSPPCLNNFAKLPK